MVGSQAAKMRLELLEDNTLMTRLMGVITAVIHVIRGKTMSNRDTVTYELKQGNKVVYVGTTNNPDRRAKEHAKDKSFTKMDITSRKMTVAGAKKKEADRLNTYRNNHSGVNPKYNKDSDG